MKKVFYSKLNFIFAFSILSLLCLSFLFFYHIKYRNDVKDVFDTRKDEISKILYAQHPGFKNKKIIKYIDLNYQNFLKQYSYPDVSIDYFHQSYKEVLNIVKNLKKENIITSKNARKIKRSIKKLDFYTAIAVLKYINLSKSDSNVVASKLYLIGKLNELAFNYKEAEKNYEEAIKLNPYKVKYYNSLAFLNYNSSRINRAIKNYETTLSMVNNNLVQNKETLSALLGLANCYRAKRDLNKAFIYYTHLLNLAEVINDKYTRQIALLNLGDISFSKGDYLNAINYYENIRITNKDKKIKKYDVLSSLNLARVYYHYGDYEKGLYYSKQVISKASKLKNIDLLASGNYYRCLNLEYLNDYKSAVVYCKRALEISREYARLMKRPENYIKIASMLDFAASIRNYDIALTNFKKAATLIEENELRYMKPAIYASIADTYFTLGNRENAYEYYNKAIHISKKLDIERGFSCINCNIGRYYLFGKDYRKALMNYNIALKDAKNVGNNSILAFVYADLGMLYQEIGKRDLAIESYKTSINIHKKIYRFDHHYFKWLESRIDNER